MPETTFAWPSQPASAPAAGWFTDPASDARLRWWDGAAWTEHVMDSPHAASAAPQPIEQWTPPAQVEQEPLVRERRRDRRAKGDSPAPVAAPAVPVPVPPSNGGNAHYVPLSQQYSPMRMLEPMRRAGSPNTPAIWFLALLPLIIIPVQLAGYYSGVTATQVGAASLLLGVIAVVFGLAIGDSVTLRRRNLAAASAAWMLLVPPLAYFIARRVKLKKAGVISTAPGNVYVLSLVAAPFVVYLAVLPLEGIRLAIGL